MARTEIVIARYQEDISWAEGRPAVLYNKGTPVTTTLEQRPLPNVGREAHTYLFHILRAWTDLADTTLFTQAGLDHLPPGVDLGQLLESTGDIVVPRLVRCREWGPDGRIVHFGIWKDKIAQGRMILGKLSLVDWFREYLGLDLAELGHVMYAPGAIFAVKKDCILRRSKDFYQRLLDSVRHHNDPEEAHYLERAWLYVFAASEVKIRFLSS